MLQLFDREIALISEPIELHLGLLRQFINGWRQYRQHEITIHLLLTELTTADCGQKVRRVHKIQRACVCCCRTTLVAPRISTASSRAHLFAWLQSTLPCSRSTHAEMNSSILLTTILIFVLSRRRLCIRQLATLPSPFWHTSASPGLPKALLVSLIVGACPSYWQLADVVKLRFASIQKCMHRLFNLLLNLYPDRIMGFDLKPRINT
jgi:hypothetical protein